MRLSVTTLLATQLCVGAAAFAVVTAGVCAAQAQTASDDADALFRQGNEFYKASRFSEAEVAYRKAWALKKTHDIAANLGHACFRVGKFRDAAEFLDFALRHHPPTGAEDKREFIRKSLDEARQHVATVRISVNRQGADVLVDGVLVGNAPLEADVFVEPGNHRIEARSPHCKDAGQGVEVAAGGSSPVTLELIDDAGTGTPPVPPGGASAPKSVPVIVLGYGLSAVGVGIGATFLGIAAGKRSDRSALQQDLTSTHATCPQASQCAALKATLGKVDTFSNGALVGFIAGGALAIGTTIYVLIPTKREEQQGLRLSPTLGETKGLLLSGTF